MSAFALEDGVVYHTYSAYARGLDGLWGTYQWLDRAPRGRNETRVLVPPPRRVRRRVPIERRVQRMLRLNTRQRGMANQRQNSRAVFIRIFRKSCQHQSV